MIQNQFLSFGRHTYSKKEEKKKHNKNVQQHLIISPPGSHRLFTLLVQYKFQITFYKRRNYFLRKY